MQLGIIQLQTQIQQLAPGCLSVIETDTRETALLLALYAIGKSRGITSLLISDEPLPKTNPLTPECSRGFQNAEFFTVRSLRRLFSDLPRDLRKCLGFKSGVLIICLFRGRLVLEDNISDLTKQLADIRACLRESGNTLLLLPWGQEPGVDDRLVAVSPALTGLALLSGIPAGDHPKSGAPRDLTYRYEIQFWTDGSSRTDTMICLLKLTGDGFCSIRSDGVPLDIFADAAKCYIAGHDFVADSGFYTRTEYFPDNKSLVDAVKEKITGATCILELRSRAEIEELAEELHLLRATRGASPVLVVWEKLPGIRNSSERLLLASGASFIFPHDARPIYMNVMLERIRNYPWQGNVPRYQEILREYREFAALGSGYQETGRFISIITESVGGNSSILWLKRSPALVILSCRNGITPGIAASLFHPSRHGDICSVWENRILVFLSSCSYEEIPATLNRIFTEPADKIFTAMSVISNRRKILKFLRDLSQDRPPAPEDLRFIRLAEQKNAGLKELRSGSALISGVANHTPPVITAISLYEEDRKFRENREYQEHMESKEYREIKENGK